MRRAVAGVAIVVLASLFVLLVPVVPASANRGTSSSSSTSCATCILVTGRTQGYGSISFVLFGVGGTWFDGAFRLATSSNLNITVTA